MGQKGSFIWTFSTSTSTSEQKDCLKNRNVSCPSSPFHYFTLHWYLHSRYKFSVCRYYLISLIVCIFISPRLRRRVHVSHLRAKSSTRGDCRQSRAFGSPLTGSFIYISELTSYSRRLQAPLWQFCSSKTLRLRVHQLLIS